MRNVKIICCVVLIFSTMLCCGCKGMGAAFGKAVVKGVAKTVVKGAGKIVARTTASIVSGAFKFVVRTSVNAVYFAKSEIEDKIIDELSETTTRKISGKFAQIYEAAANSNVKRTVTEHANEAMTFVKAEIPDELLDKVFDSSDRDTKVADKLNKFHGKTIGSSVTKNFLADNHLITKLKIDSYFSESSKKN